jgi:hypothetical protein
LFRNEAIKEADEVLVLPIDLRIAAFEKILHRFLAGTKYSIPHQGKKIVWILKRKNATCFYL